MFHSQICFIYSNNGYLDYLVRPSSETRFNSNRHGLKDFSLDRQMNQCQITHAISGNNRSHDPLDPVNYNKY